MRKNVYFFKKNSKYKITNQQLIPHSQKDHGIKMLAKFSLFSTIFMLLAQLCELDKIQNTDKRISGIFQHLDHDLILSQNKAFIILDFDLSKLGTQFDEVRIMISKYKLGIQELSLKQIGVKKLGEALTQEFTVVVDGFDSLKQILGHQPSNTDEEAFERNEQEILKAELTRSETLGQDLAEDLQIPSVSNNSRTGKRRKRTTTLASTEASSSILEDYLVIGPPETTITPVVESGNAEVIEDTTEVIKSEHPSGIESGTTEIAGVIPEVIKTETPPPEIADDVIAISHSEMGVGNATTVTEPINVDGTDLNPYETNLEIQNVDRINDEEFDHDQNISNDITEASLTTESSTVKNQVWKRPFLSEEARQNFWNQAISEQKIFTQRAFSKRQRERAEYERRKKILNETISGSMRIVDNKLVKTSIPNLTSNSITVVEENSDGNNLTSNFIQVSGDETTGFNSKTDSITVLRRKKRQEQLLGVALSFAAGMGLESYLKSSEIRGIENHITNLNDQNSLIIKHLNASHEEIIANRQTLIDLNTAVNKSIMVLSTEQKEFHAAQLYAIISQTIQNLYKNLQTFETVLNTAVLHKKVHLKTVTHKGAQEIVKDIKDLANNYNLHSTLENGKDVYFLPCSTVVLTTGFRLILTTYLYRKPFHFKLFEYQSTPFRISKEIVTEVQLSKKILALAHKNKFGHTYLELAKSTLEKCEKFGKYLVCTDRKLIAKTEKNPSCLLSLFLSKTEQIQELCPLQLKNVSTDITPINKSEFIVLLKSAQTGEISCNETVIHRALQFKELPNKILLQPNCVLLIDNFLMEGPMISNLQQRSADIKFWPIGIQALISNISTDKLKSIMENFGKISNVKSISKWDLKILQDLNTENKQAFFGEFTNPEILNTALALLGIFVTTIFSIYLWVNFKRFKNKDFKQKFEDHPPLLPILKNNRIQKDH